jgi:hypothetical protein
VPARPAGSGAWRERIATAGLFTGGVGLLAAYLLVVHVRAGDDVMHAVLLGVFATALALAAAGHRPLPTVIAWAVALAGAVAILLPQARAALDIAYPDLTVILLSAAGVGFGVALVAGGRRLLPGGAFEDRPGDSAP